MNKLIRPAIIFILSIFLSLACAVVAFSTKAPGLNNTAAAAFISQAQETPTPQAEADNSEVGSTDEIVVMGGMIAAIVLLPLILQRKAWTQKDQS